MRQEILVSDEIRAIISAIQSEADQGSKPVPWTIRESKRQGNLWSVSVEPIKRSGRKPNQAQLDESLEGAAAWWPGPPKGSADVLSVVPEDLQINLRYATSQVPHSGSLTIYPIRFLEKLLEAWSTPSRAELFYSALQELRADSSSVRFKSPSSTRFAELRVGQRQAFDLLRYRFSFLWGPPGTGKTHTLGALLASFLIENPTARVLLLSGTNAAVDLALVGVDKALERLSKTLLSAKAYREGCKRIGVHFGAKHYEDRRHLIRRTDANLIQMLVDLEANRPDPADGNRYFQWKSKQDELRRRMRVQARETLQSSRLAALTCTRGIFSYSELEETGPFDLVVFDEASQVSLVHSLPFLALGNRILFAGDPKQLAPIVTATDYLEVKRWLGCSPFEFMREGHVNTTILTEQSRMAVEICGLVSKVFYGGRLTVSTKALADPVWLAERSIKKLPRLGADRVCCISINDNAEYHAGFGGFVRDESADVIVAGVQAAMSEAGPNDIAILTPYRAQRAIIRKKLRNAGIRGVEVSTVHRAQGSEKRIIFFDPVNGPHKAVTDRLINVALSRAKSRLFLTMSYGDLANDKLSQIWALIRPRPNAAGAPQLAEVLRDAKQLKAFEKTHKKVAYQGKLYLINASESSGQRIIVQDCSTGKSKKLDVPTVLRLTANQVMKGSPKLEMAEETALGGLSSRAEMPVALPTGVPVTSVHMDKLLNTTAACPLCSQYIGRHSLQYHFANRCPKKTVLGWPQLTTDHDSRWKDDLIGDN